MVNVTADLAALALQGPNSRAILKQIVSGVDLDELKYFWLAQGTVDNFPITITRTGYTGDLGYELWVEPQHAERLWDCLLDVGLSYGLLPAGHCAFGHGAH